MTSAVNFPRFGGARQIDGSAAALLPFQESGDVDWAAFEQHLERIVRSGLTPAVNMDTGYTQLLDGATRRQVLAVSQRLAPAGFFAGAFVADEPGDDFDVDSYLVAVKEIEGHGGIPVIFPSYGLNQSGADHQERDRNWILAIKRLADDIGPFVGFELGEMFVPYGRIASIETYERLIRIENCVGAKHSSLSRELEWQRLALRDEVRPDFKVFSGNDLAIDMVFFGSDYLLGLAAFAPEAFALRDFLWAEADRRVFELNDLLAYLGQFSFRAPVPAYRHDCALFLTIAGVVPSDVTPEGAPRRPGGDREVLGVIYDRLKPWLEEAADRIATP